MRITSGQYKNRVIKMPEGIRPTQEMVRKALFDILGNIAGLSFLELFAGSGAIGFEAASRDAREVVLVEHNRDCQLVIEKNIDSLRLATCSLYPFAADKAIQIFHKDKRQFDIIFLDPPYYGELTKKILQTLSAYDILAPNGFIIAQHFKKDNLPAQLGVLSLFRQARYGDTVLSFFKKG